MPEVVFPAAAPSAIIGGGRVIASPASFYCAGEDRLRIVAASSIGGSVKLQWRFAKSDGAIVANSQEHTLVSDRGVTTKDYELGVGSLLNVTAFSTFAQQVGQTYVMVQLVRGIGTAAIVLGTLMAGYVALNQAIGFPGSPILRSTEGPGWMRSIQGTQPAAGVEIVEFVPGSTRWRLQWMRLKITCSAAGANRFPTLQIFQSVSDLVPTLFTYPTRIIGAAEPDLYSVAAVGQLSPVSDGLKYHNALPLPPTAILTQTNAIRTVTTNLQAGDQWDAPVYAAEEWLDVN